MNYYVVGAVAHVGAGSSPPRRSLQQRLLGVPPNKRPDAQKEVSLRSLLSGTAIEETMRETAAN